jgi:Protein of unknown function (DUF1222).
METRRRKTRAGWCAPHQPRLDWQMWFAALGTPRENPWFVALIYRLLQGSHEVNSLLATTHSRTNRRVTFARCFIAIDLQRWRSFARPARGGNVRSFANTCQCFRWNSSAKSWRRESSRFLQAEMISRQRRTRDRRSLGGASLERRALARIFAAQWRRKNRSSPRALWRRFCLERCSASIFPANAMSLRIFQVKCASISSGSCPGTKFPWSFRHTISQRRESFFREQ